MAKVRDKATVFSDDLLLLLENCLERYNENVEGISILKF